MHVCHLKKHEDIKSSPEEFSYTAHKSEKLYDIGK